MSPSPGGHTAPFRVAMTWPGRKTCPLVPQGEPAAPRSGLACPRRGWGWQGSHLTRAQADPSPLSPHFPLPDRHMRRRVTRHKVGSCRVPASVPVGGSARRGATGVGHTEKHNPGALSPRGDGAVGRKAAGALPCAPARSGAFLDFCVSPSARQRLGPLRASARVCMRPRVCTPVRAGLRVGSPVPLWATASPHGRSRHAGPLLRIFFSSFVSLSLALTLSGAPAVPSRAAGCWEVAWLPLRGCCAGEGGKGA